MNDHFLFKFLILSMIPRILAYLTAPLGEATQYLAVHLCVISSFPF